MHSLLHARDRNTILIRLHSLTPDDTRRWGRMTVNQMICHLADANSGAIGPHSMAALATLPKGIPNLPRPLLAFFALRLPVPWPRNTPTVPAVEQGIGGTPPTSFSQDRARLFATFDALTVHPGPWPPHPYFGNLTTSQWMRWGYLHLDHHLRQFGR